jgi:hypothetical protein
LCPGALIDPLTFTGQVPSQDDQGRPDIIGEDGSGTRVVIEAKFDAELTAAQLGRDYLYRLPSDQAGALVFLVPADRLPAIWPRLLTGPAQLAHLETVHATDADKPFLAHQLPGGRVLAAVSWTQLLAAMRLSMESASETDALGDLTQIEGLVAWRTRTGWPPYYQATCPIGLAVN